MEVLLGVSVAAALLTSGVSLFRWFRNNRNCSGRTTLDGASAIRTPAGRPRRKMGQFQAEVIRYTYM